MSFFADCSKLRGKVEARGFCTELSVKLSVRLTNRCTAFQAEAPTVKVAQRPYSFTMRPIVKQKSLETVKPISSQETLVLITSSSERARSSLTSSVLALDRCISCEFSKDWSTTTSCATAESF